MSAVQPCAHVDCAVYEPGRLLERRLIATNFTAFYCGEHDPLNDPRVSDLWTRV